MYKFEKVYRKVSGYKEDLKYELINENIEMAEDTVSSLLRGSMATIKYKEDYMELYYNM